MSKYVIIPHNEVTVAMVNFSNSRDLASAVKIVKDGIDCVILEIPEIYLQTRTTFDQYQWYDNLTEFKSVMVNNE